MLMIKAIYLRSVLCMLISLGHQIVESRHFVLNLRAFLVFHDLQGPPLTSILNNLNHYTLHFVLLGNISVTKPGVDLMCVLDLDTQVFIGRIVTLLFQSNF